MEKREHFLTMSTVQQCNSTERDSSYQNRARDMLKHEYESIHIAIARYIANAIIFHIYYFSWKYALFVTFYLKTKRWNLVESKTGKKKVLFVFLRKFMHFEILQNYIL